MIDKKQIPILNRIPMTRVKLIIARMLYTVLKIILRKDRHRIRRGGISYEVDLTEGIDLSLFLFGNFQSYITGNKYFSLKKDAVVFDIGANIGSMTLKFSQMTPHGRVYAFEPTDYAFNKLLRNISMNPELSKRIIPVQSFVRDRSEPDHQIEAYASWKVNGKSSDTHPLHGGTIQTADAVSGITLDDFCEKEDIQRVDLIKIDTDGHELRVLRGARKTVEKFFPYIIFEVGLYVMEEQGIVFKKYFDYFSSLDYILINSKNGKVIAIENYFKQIPLKATTDIIALPPGRLA
ncbi:FkbM family methyltransferase [Thermodesulfobacteriota bacterium]